MVTQDERNREAFFRDTWADLIVETLRSTAIVTLVIYWIWQLAVGGDTRGSIASNTVILTIYGIGRPLG